MPLSGVVALDGPSGTGKSTVARRLALRLGARYLDTGAMYRAVTWAVLEVGVDLTDAAEIARVTERADPRVTTDPDHQRVTIDGYPVDRSIRSARVTAAVSAVSAVPEVRDLLVAGQRALIAAALTEDGIVVEGRDIGTVVAPEAELKVYLTASPERRAARRSRQDGISAVDAREALRRRDEYDSNRAVSPLRTAPDAVVVDTSDMSAYEVVDQLVDLATRRGMVKEA